MRTPRLSKADLERYAVVAKAQRVTIEIERGGTIFRISPALDHKAQSDVELDREIEENERRWVKMPRPIMRGCKND